MNRPERFMTMRAGNGQAARPRARTGLATSLVAGACAWLAGAGAYAATGGSAAASQAQPTSNATVVVGTGDPSLPDAAPNVRGPDGSTPLMWAVYRQDVKEVKRLLDAGARVDAANLYGATAMQMAATVANTAILKLLLKAGADVDSPNAEGQTALMLVA